MTWAKQPWQTVSVEDSHLPRLFPEHTVKLPYVKDLFSTGSDKLSDTDILVFTNSDICVANNCCLRIAESMQLNDATYAFRRDFTTPWGSLFPTVI